MIRIRKFLSSGGFRGSGSFLIIFVIGLMPECDRNIRQCKDEGQRHDAQLAIRPDAFAPGQAGEPAGTLDDDRIIDVPPQEFINESEDLEKQRPADGQNPPDPIGQGEYGAEKGFPDIIAEGETAKDGERVEQIDNGRLDLSENRILQPDGQPAER